MAPKVKGTTSTFLVLLCVSFAHGEFRQSILRSYDISSSSAPNTTSRNKTQSSDNKANALTVSMNGGNKTVKAPGTTQTAGGLTLPPDPKVGNELSDGEKGLLDDTKKAFNLAKGINAEVRRNLKRVSEITEMLKSHVSAFSVDNAGNQKALNAAARSLTANMQIPEDKPADVPDAQRNLYDLLASAESAANKANSVSSLPINGEF